MIRKASKKELMKTLRHPSVLCRIGNKPKKIKCKNNYVATDGVHNLYFIFYNLGDKCAEWHPVAIREHRIAARKLIKESLDFMKKLGFKKVFTLIPDKLLSTRKLAENMGFNQVEDKPTVFERVLV